MSERKLFVCSSCRGFWSSTGSNPSCPKCGGSVQPVDMDYDTFSSWTDEEKASFKQSYLATHNFTDGPTAVFTKPAPSDFWINGLDTALNITIAVFAILALVVLIAGAQGGAGGFFIGLLGAALVVVMGFLAVAGMKIFIGMAKDLKAIRKQLEK